MLQLSDVLVSQEFIHVDPQAHVNIDEAAMSCTATTLDSSYALNRANTTVSLCRHAG